MNDVIYVPDDEYGKIAMRIKSFDSYKIFAIPVNYANIYKNEMTIENNDKKSTHKWKNKDIRDIFSWFVLENFVELHPPLRCHT